MARKPALKLEHLECRTLPAIFGIPWNDGRHLTLSFVPDGTDVDGVASNLFSAMPGSSVRWQTEILRAVETWAINANINVAVVPDSGAPLGTPGAPEGDPRFGDIRIAARPLSDNELAMTTPSGFLGGTQVGDIILNSNDRFKINAGSSSTRADLYTVLLQEVGHALGVSNSADPASVMYETYGGARTGLSAGDVASIQALYGVRTGDAFEGASGNDTLATATTIGEPNWYSWATGASVVAQGDITTQTDVDYFKVQTLPLDPYGLTVQLNSSSSLLAPKLTVYDPSGNVVGSTQSGNPQTGDVSVTLASVQASAYYTIKVEGANATFDIGSYQVKVVFNPNAPDVTAGGGATLNDAHTNDSINSATTLSTAAGYAANAHYSTTATLRDASDVDYYKVHSPSAGANQQNVLTLNVRALDPTVVAPVAQVYDSSYALVSTTILANGNGTYTLQLPSAASNQDYYVRITAGNGGSGDYQLDVDFRSPVINLQSFASGSLTASSATSYSTLTANRSQIMDFLLSATSVNAAVQAGVRMTVFDSQGHVTATLFAKSGQTVSLTTYLAQGTYTVRIEGLTPAGVNLPALTYALRGTTLTDPIGPTGSDPTLNSDGSATDNTDWTQMSADYYTSLLFDTVTDVLW